MKHAKWNEKLITTLKIKNMIFFIIGILIVILCAPIIGMAISFIFSIIGWIFGMIIEALTGGKWSND